MEETGPVEIKAGIMAEHWTSRRELAALAAVAAAVLSLRLYFALRTATMAIIPDEYIYSEIAHELAHQGTLSVRGTSAGFPALLYPVSVSPLWSLFGVGTAYHLTQVFNAVCASLAALPAYLLCRWLGFRPLLRLGIATLAIVIPGLAFSGYVMADSLGYLLALSAVAAATRALTRPGWRLEATFLVLAGLAAFTRIQYLFLLATLPLAALLLEPRHPLRVARRFRLTFGLGGVAAVLAMAIGLSSLLGYYHGVLDLGFHPLGLIRWIGSDAYVLVFAVGVFVVPGALVGVALALTRPRIAAEHAFALMALLVAAFLLIEAGVYASNGAERVQERYLLLLLPLAAIAFGISVEHGSAGWMPAAVISTGLVLVMLAYPITTFNAPLTVQDSPTLAATLQLQEWYGYANVPLIVVTVAIALLALAVAAAVRPHLVLPLGLVLSIVLLGAGSAVAGHRYLVNSDWVARRYLPRDKDAVDRLGLDRLTYLRVYPSSRTEVLELMFWNRSIRRLAGLARTGAVDVYGFAAAGIDRYGRLRVAGTPPRRAVVIDFYGSRSTLSGGRRLLRKAAFQVWRPAPSLRFDFMVQGLYWDGWLGSSGTATIWPDASGRSRGVLHLDLRAPERQDTTTITLGGLDRKYSIALAGRERRTLAIPLDTRGRARLSFRSNTADSTSDGRFVSVRARVWFVRTKPTSTNAARAANRYKPR
jgi:hypothetical protein